MRPFITEEAHYRFRIYWNGGDEGGDDELGLCLGSARYRKMPDPEKNPGEWEIYQVDKALLELADVKDSTGYSWETEAGMKKALRVAKEVLKVKKPLPDWAVKARAAGWKPPAGWKP